MSIKGRFGRRRAQFAAAVMVAAGLTMVGTTQAQAYSPEACVFVAPSGAPIGVSWFAQGHVGWGFKTGANSYTWGATEGPPNQSWYKKSGTRAQMIASFHNGGALNKKYYKYYKCVTAGGNVAKAEKTRKTVQAWRFVPVLNNCLDQTYLILGSYGVNLPSPNTIPQPNTWYRTLGIWPYTGWREAKL